LASTPTTATIFTLVREDLAAVERALTRAVETEQPLMRRLLGLVLPGSGKRLRPALALLCGRVNDRRPEPLISFAASLEMLHTATLVHDDIVDQAELRRGEATLNIQTSNSIAVLVGDYMFAQAAAHVAAAGHLGVITDFAQAAMTIIGGQIDEAWTEGGIDLAKEKYYNRIGSKTAALFALAVEGGAKLSNAEPAVVDALRRYGYQLGLAFQVVDDILDVVGDRQNLGKPVGSDIRQGTVTLPAILVRDQVPAEVFRSAFHGDGHREEPIERLLEAIRIGGGVDGAYAEAERLAREARDSLQAVPEGEIRDALADLAGFVVRRNT
jgi:geranylgeranyl pyrophosphate synthase